MQTVNKSKTMKASLFGLAAVATLGAATMANAETYTVQQGDTLSAIAKKNNTTVSNLVSENGIQDANKISVGQVLSLNGGSQLTAETNAEASVVETPITEAATETQTSASSLSSSEAAAKEEIAQRESSGSYTAQNGQYYGRYQLTLSYLNGDLSPENQERVADNYVTSRYGSWTAALAFWNANGWY